MFLLFCINHNLTGMTVSKGNYPQWPYFRKELVAFSGLMVVLMLQVNYHDSNINVI